MTEQMTNIMLGYFIGIFNFIIPIMIYYLYKYFKEKSQ